jgi:hypothetical protein
MSEVAARCGAWGTLIEHPPDVLLAPEPTKELPGLLPQMPLDSCSTTIPSALLSALRLQARKWQHHRSPVSQYCTLECTVHTDEPSGLVALLSSQCSHQQLTGQLAARTPVGYHFPVSCATQPGSDISGTCLPDRLRLVTSWRNHPPHTLSHHRMQQRE